MLQIALIQNTGSPRLRTFPQSESVSGAGNKLRSVEVRGHTRVRTIRAGLYARPVVAEFVG